MAGDKLDPGRRMAINRSNDNWVDHLRSDGAVQDSALCDLRGLLVSGLRKPFGGYDGVDDNFLEDVAQEALMKVLKNLEQFEGKSRFTTWAMSIAVRLGLTELRRKRWKDVSLDQVLEGSHRVPPAVDSTAGPELAAQQRTLIEKMYQIINTELSQKQCDVLLAELKGMPQEEIGRRMGSNRNAVYKLTHDARKRLKTSLEASGYTVTDIQAAFGW